MLFNKTLHSSVMDSIEVFLKLRLIEAFQKAQQCDQFLDFTVALDSFINDIVQKHISSFNESTRMAASTLCLIKNNEIPKDLVFPESSFKLRTPKITRYGSLSTNFLIPLSNKYIRFSKCEQSLSSTQTLAQQWAICLSQYLENLCYEDSSLKRSFAIECESRSKGFLNFFFPEELESSLFEPHLSSKREENDGKAQRNSMPLTFIGKVRSCFKLKYGTPRQGSLVPSSRGVVELFNICQIDSLMGLEEFSHIWIIYIFNKQSEQSWKSKVSPVKLNGERIGVFATRSPHRPSPIGLCVAKLEAIKGRKIYVRGIDVVDETPVVDIKPYHIADTFPVFQNCTFPDWVEQSVRETAKLEVIFQEGCIQEFIILVNGLRSKKYAEPNDFFDLADDTNTLKNCSSFEDYRGEYGGVYPFIYYDSVTTFIQTLKEAIALDPRSIQQMHQQECGEALQHYLDNFEILYRIIGKTAKVLRIDFCEDMEAF